MHTGGNSPCVYGVVLDKRNSYPPRSGTAGVESGREEHLIIQPRLVVVTKWPPWLPAVANTAFVTSWIFFQIVLGSENVSNFLRQCMVVWLIIKLKELGSHEGSRWDLHMSSPVVGLYCPGSHTIVWLVATAKSNKNNGLGMLLVLLRAEFRIFVRKAVHISR